MHLIPRIKEFVEKLPENLKPGVELRMSSAGDCPRSLDYNLQVGRAPILFEDLMRMEMGHGLHYLIQDLFSRAMGDDLYDMEREISLTTPKGHVIPGHPDGRIKSLKATFELKSVSEATFQMVMRDNKPLDSHILQGNLYAYTMKDEFVLVLYVNRNTGEFKEFLFEREDFLAMTVVTKFDQAYENKKLGVLTPRPYTDKSGSPCWFCEHRDPCYEGFNAQVERALIKDIIDPDLVLAARNAIVYRDTRLEHEKLEEKVKELLGHSIFMKHNTKQANMKDDVGEMVVDITVGKNQNLITRVRTRRT